MRVVIDTNRLAADELFGFLSLSTKNFAVLTDYVMMERFKPGNLDNLAASFRVLRKFPAQVLRLKGTADVCQLARRQDIATAMIDADETAAFPDFCRYLDQASVNLNVRKQLELRSTWAQSHLANMLAMSAGFETEMAEFTAIFTANELNIIRRNEPLTEAISEKFSELTYALARAGFERAPMAVNRPTDAQLSEHFIFRNSLATIVYMLSLARRGVGQRRPDRARNDTVDVLLATYGTYFNGVMSEDALTNQVHSITRQVLVHTGASISSDYVPDYMMKVAEYLDGMSEA